MRLLVLLVVCTALAAAADRPSVLMVVTSHGQLPDGKPTGYWLAEVAHPWVRFHDAGYRVVVASPGGGEAPMDPRSRDLDDPENARFWNELGGEAALADTRELAAVEAEGWDAIFFAGGHGTMWDFPANPEIQRLVRALHAREGVIAAVCHGPAAFVDLSLADGEQLVAGKRLTAFSNAEERAVGLAEAMPFLLVDRLRSQGAEIEVADNWQTKVVTDGQLVTGQNPASAAATAEAVIARIDAR